MEKIMTNENGPSIQEIRDTNATTFREELNKIKNSDAEYATQETFDEVKEVETQPEEESTKPDFEDSVVEQDNADLDDESDSGHMIPKGRFNKVIQQKKSLEKELEEARAEKIRAQTELELYNRALERLQVQKQEEQSFEPLDSEAHQIYAQQYQNLQKKLSQLEQKAEQDRAVQTLNYQDQMFSKTHPDFSKACDYLIEAQAKMYSMLYEDVEQAKDAAKHQLGVAAQSLLQQGKNVAQTFYTMSKNLGYTPPSNGPNLSAINQNMAKSKIADLNSVPLSPSSRGANLTKLEEFEKHYNPKDKQSFQNILNELKKSK
jgi:uncharacterized protein YozE (UPF0346 family)